MINVFIPHRWGTNDYEIIKSLLDEVDCCIKDYSVPEEKQLNKIDRRYNVDPQIQRKIKWSSVIICSNRPALSGGMAIEEIKYAIRIGKPIVAVQTTEYTNSALKNMKVPVIQLGKYSLEKWIEKNVLH